MRFFRLSLVVTLGAVLIFTDAPPSRAQTVNQRTSDPHAVAIVQQSLVAMNGAVAVADVSLSASVTSTAGSDIQSGTALLQAKGTQESKVALSLSDSSYTEIRNVSDGAPAGRYIDSNADSTAHALSLHNCFTEAAWFVPSLSDLASVLSDPNANLMYVGQESWDDKTVDHIRTWETVSSPDAAAVKLIAHLSTTDIYLDSATHLPVAIKFATHPAKDAKIDIPVEIRFDNYQQTSGLLLPMHIQKFLNGTLNLDFTMNSAEVNSGLPDSIFATNE